ncbi:cytochrome P450, partial [Streptomyces sp. JV178]|uniref:cytochrome P450 n=1 Tax=Streptomyces sp. JV178 TaxID=858632 RepID=UPI00211E878E
RKANDVLMPAFALGAMRGYPATMLKVARVIRQRRADGDQSTDDLLGRMLHTLLHSRLRSSGGTPIEVTGEPLDDVNIRYQAITFLIAGHETTSGLLSFALYFLPLPADRQRGRHPPGAVAPLQRSLPPPAGPGHPRDPDQRGHRSGTCSRPPPRPPAR